MSLLKTNSPVLARIPWYTLLPEDVSQLLTVFPFKGFVRQLVQYGASLLTFQNSSMLTLEMQRLLGIDLPGIEATALSPKALTTNDWARLCTVISAYRLLDIAALIHGNAIRGPEVERCYLESDRMSLRGMERLADWPALLLNFRKTLKSSGVLQDDPVSPGEGSPPVRLLRMISRNDSIQKYTAVEANFLYAAMHLACMNELTFSKGVCPDIPDSFDDTIRDDLEPCNQDNMSTGDQEELHDLIKAVKQATSNSEGLSAMRAPLQLSLLISPIYLLLPFRIFKKTVSRQKMVNVSSRLGNQKPQLLLDVEHSIWNTLFSLASANLDPLHLLLGLEKELPWDRICSVESERGWFKLDSLAPCINQASHPPTTAVASRPSILVPPPPYLSPMPTCAPFSTGNGMPTPIDNNRREASTVRGNVMGDPGTSHPQADDGSCDEMNECEFNGMEVDRNTDGTEDENDRSGAEHNNSSDFMRADDGGDDGAADEGRSNGSIVVNCDGGEGASNEGNSIMDTSEDLSKLGPSSRSQIILPAQWSSKGLTSQGSSASRKRRRNNDEIPRIFSSGTQVDPIDVDLCCSPWEPVTIREFVRVEEISFKKDKPQPKVQCDIELQAFDATGSAHKFTPEFHFDDYNIRIKKFFERIEAGYNAKGEPPHIADPSHSGFAIIPFEHFRSIPTLELQQLLRHKNIVVTEYSQPDHQFDKRGMRTLGPLDSRVPIQDYSVPRSDYNLPTTVTGLARDILDNATSPDGKILNGLDFPMWKDAHGDRSSYATDMVAWGSVRGRSHCGHATTPYPTEHMRWGLAGTANTVTSMHIDSDGFSTFIEVLCGKKVWVVYRESPELPLSSTDVFFNRFLLDDIDKDASYGLEAVVLRPGDLLLMRPGTPHFVYGPENAICHGGYFYSTSLMQTTLQSLIHSFVLGDFIANTSHHPSRQLLRRIVVFFGLGLLERCLELEDDEYMHLPDVKTIDGLLDLLAACILAILGNVLDFRTYSAPNQREHGDTAEDQNALMSNYDWNNIPGNERMAICYTRGVALAIFHWVRSNCVVKSPDGNVIEDLPSRYILQVLNTLLAYKAKTMRKHLKGAPHCDIAMLRIQIANVVKCDAAIEKTWARNEDVRDDSLKFTLDDLYSIVWKSTTVMQQDASQYQDAGMTPLDRTFLQSWSKLYSPASPNLPRAVKRLRASVYRSRAGSSSRTSWASGHSSPGPIYRSDRSYPKSMSPSTDSPSPHSNRRWTTDDAGTPGKDHLSSEQVVMGMVKSYKAYFSNPDNLHDKSFEPHPERYPVVELEYPNQGASERFILLAPKDRDHYNPITDLEQTLYTIVEYYLTNDQKALFGPVPSALANSLPSPSPLCFIPNSNSTSSLTSDSSDSSLATLCPSSIDHLPVLLAVQHAIQVQHGPLFLKAMKRVNELLYSIKYLAVSETFPPPNVMMTMVESWTGNPLPEKVLMRIIDENYQRTVGPNIRSLRLYQPFSSTVYGELMPPFIHEIIQTTGLNQNSLFLDLGSGVANVVVQASLQSGCTSYGIELLPHPARIAKDVLEQIKIRCRMWGVGIGEMELEEGNMLESHRVDELISNADVVLVDNKVFEEKLNEALRSKFLDLKEGACVISLKPFVRAINTRVTERNVDDISAIFDIEEKTYYPGSVSWTSSGGHYYLHKVDRLGYAKIKERWKASMAHPLTTLMQV